ncbi:MAG: DUF721 domain-containing protein [Wenzhouxiangella sp.]|nr:MAG: DUF721 domain-containing protein [Wenzhouxiangella sp.]
MEKAAEKALNEVVATTTPLARTLRLQRLFEALDREVQPVLSRACRGRVRVACINSGTLVLAADSPAWASRGRLEAPAALEAARAVWPETLQRVQVIVAPPSAWATPTGQSRKIT